jgi:WD40 repeat protein
MWVGLVNPVNGDSFECQDLPIRAWQEHTREVFSVDWSNIKKDTFASSSWDGTVKLVRPCQYNKLRVLIIK